MNRQIELKEALQIILAPAQYPPEEQIEAERIVRLRIRVLLQQLADAKDDATIRELCSRGYFGLRELDALITKVIDQKNEYMIICLIMLKAERYGFSDREWEL